MKSRLPEKLTYSNVIASLALFVALSGVAVAAGVANNSVGAAKLKNGAVTTKKLRKEAVTNHKLGPGSVSGGKLASGAVTSSKLGANSVTGGAIANGAVSGAKLANNAVTNSKIANGVVGTNKLGNEVVTTAKLADKSVTAAKLSDEIGPSVSNLRSGQTLRGVFELGGDVKAARSSQSFQYTLANAPAFSGNVLDQGKTSSACSGTGNDGTNPGAAAGQLCVYITGSSGLSGLEFGEASVSRLGFGLFASFAAAEASNVVRGVWAVTAP